jgi:phosphatidylinositol glycan class K
VRSDLFHRSLERTLITDFFGGVAHAEMIDPPTDTYASRPFTEEAGVEEASRDLPANDPALEAVTEEAAWHATARARPWWARDAQVMASQVIVAALVGYVVLRERSGLPRAA